MPGEAREFEFTERDFKRLAKIVRAASGISLSPSKFDLVYSRLAKRVRHNGLSSFAQFADLLEAGNEAELAELTNAMTTNVTAFLRESYHFDTLCDEVLAPRLDADPKARIRIWSAACSTGEEPYSVVTSALARCPSIAQADFKVLATDLDSEVIATGTRGVYDERAVEPLPPEWRRRFMQKGRAKSEGSYRMRPEVAQYITFKTLNLMQAWPIKGPFDAIFCRNVMIYFDDETRKMLVERFRQLLVVGGRLFIGHSETLPAGVGGFEFDRRTTYRRAA